MTSTDGGFYSAQRLDAETNGVEGEYYVWEARDIDRLLRDKSPQFKDFYHVKDLSEFEQGNVLRLSVDQLPGPALVRGKSLLEMGHLNSTKRFSALRQEAACRSESAPKLLRDEKILTGWNGLMIGAFARAGTSLNQPQFCADRRKSGGHSC